MKTIIPGTQLFSCRACNYDLCFDCAVKTVYKMSLSHRCVKSSHAFYCSHTGVNEE